MPIRWPRIKPLIHPPLGVESRCLPSRSMTGCGGVLRRGRKPALGRDGPVDLPASNVCDPVGPFLHLTSNGSGLPGSVERAHGVADRSPEPQQCRRVTWPAIATVDGQCEEWPYWVANITDAGKSTGRCPTRAFPARQGHTHIAVIDTTATSSTRHRAALDQRRCDPGGNTGSA